MFDLCKHRLYCLFSQLVVIVVFDLVKFLLYLMDMCVKFDFVLFRGWGLFMFLMVCGDVFVDVVLVEFFEIIF